MTEPYPPPTPEERQLRAQRLGAGGLPAGGAPVANPLGGGGGGLQGSTAGIPNYVWLIGAALVAVVGIIWWRSRNATAAPNNSTISTTNPTSPVDASTAGLATDQYESLLALLRDLQGQQSTPLPPPGTIISGPIPGGPPTMTPFQGYTGPLTPQPPVYLPAPGSGSGTPAPVAAPAPAPAPSPTAPKTYTVQTGDSLSSIASKFGTTWQTLYANNKNTINNAAAAHNIYTAQYNSIWPGERLVVP